MSATILGLVFTADAEVTKAIPHQEENKEQE